MRETIDPKMVQIEENFRQVCVKIKKKGANHSQ